MTNILLNLEKFGKGLQGLKITQNEFRSIKCTCEAMNINTET